MADKKSMETHPVNNTDQDVGTIFNELVKAANPVRQKELLGLLQTVPGVQYLDVIALALPLNPLLELSSDDRAALVFKHRLNDLSVAKQVARDTPGKRTCVFCLPKSGSSFTQSAISAALASSFIHLTSHAHDFSALGMNGREQELDELAILYAIFRTRGSFVAQHHTRSTPFLCEQLRYFGIQPVVMVRNVFDVIVSADEMFRSWRQTGTDWTRDHFTLPVDYEHRDTADRLAVLASSLGVWAINFYLSWRRCEQAKLVSPLWLSYEEDVTNKEVFKQRVAGYLGMNEEQSKRLAAYVANPDVEKSRLNVGTVGRGTKFPDAARAIVMDYAKLFRNEFADNDVRILFGDAKL